MAHQIHRAAFLPLTAIVLTVILPVGGPARAEVAPLLARSVAPLVPVSLGPGGSNAGSLFAGTADGSLFAPIRDRTPPAPPQRGSVSRLLTLIARAEAGSDGYDAVQRGAAIRPPRPPTAMTLGEIYRWIAATPGQPHAIGRYQFIPETLRRVAAARGFGPETRFTPEVQDALATVLLTEAGLPDFEAGTLGRRAFMGNLARIWAGLPLPDGRSFYEGFAGNRATMSWAEFENGVARIWPLG